MLSFGSLELSSYCSYTSTTSGSDVLDDDALGVTSGV